MSGKTYTPEDTWQAFLRYMQGKYPPTNKLTASIMLDLCEEAFKERFKAARQWIEESGFPERLPDTTRRNEGQNGAVHQEEAALPCQEEAPQA